MKLATEEVELSINNVLYCQINGTAIGSTLGPTLANILMDILNINFNPISFKV